MVTRAFQIYCCGHVVVYLWVPDLRIHQSAKGQRFKSGQSFIPKTYGNLMILFKDVYTVLFKFSHREGLIVKSPSVNGKVARADDVLAVCLV